MKKKFFLISMLTVLIGVTAFSQNKKLRTPLEAEEEIKMITVTGNIHVLLVEDQPENIAALTQPQMVDKLKINIYGDHLTISPSKRAVPGEPLYAFVRVHDLRRIELKGNATVTSYGILNSKNLDIEMNENSRLAVRSTGVMQVRSKFDYQLIKENGHYSVYAMKGM